MQGQEAFTLGVRPRSRRPARQAREGGSEKCARAVCARDERARIREMRRSVPADRRALPHFSPEQYQKLQEIRRHELQRAAEKKLNQ